VNVSGQALEGIRVVDAGTLFAGPAITSYLSDFGADVLKIEHPNGDSSRRNGHTKDGVALWWKYAARNKRAMTLDYSQPEGRDVFLKIAKDVDIIVENFRVGTFERWGLSYEELSRENPGLILVRVTGFGQVGPMAHRAGFGTLAEAMSGFAYSTGQPDGPPTLPPFGLADSITGMMGAFAAMVALRARDATGKGQVIDLAIIEPILHVLGPQIPVYEAMGIVDERPGNRSVINAPRNTYLTKDGRWVAVSTSAQNIAERVARLVGRPDFVEQPWFATGTGRVAHVEEIDGAVAEWVAQRTADEVVAEFEKAEAAVAMVYSVADVVKDPQYAALGTVVRLPDSELGEVALPNVPFRLSETPGRLRWPGRPKSQDTEDVLTSLDYGAADIERLRESRVI
jgi:formyl-CoA transferase